MSPELRIVHVSPRVQARGGIETLHGHNRTLPLRQHFVALLDRGPEARPDYTNLNFNWRTPLGVMRREFARAMAPHRGSIVLYHNAWCLPLLAGVDGAARRMAVCHAAPAFHARDLPGSRGLLDGVVGVTPGLAAAWPDLLPELEPERTGILPLPILPPPGMNPARRKAGKIVLGYAGRVVEEQKRLDRLPAFLAALAHLGFDCEFEVLGDGPLRPALERQLGQRVRFHGWVDGVTYWQVMARWDGAVFFSDNEGGPIALLEAMAAGAIPVYPDIGGSVGDLYAPRVDPACFYRAGEVAAAARAVQAIFSRPAGDREVLRMRAQELTRGHTVADYGRALREISERVAALPRLSASNDAVARHWSDALPLGLVTRTAPSLLWRRR